MLAIAEAFSTEDSPIDKLLKEQARLVTAVSRFSREHERNEVDERYRQLIPLTNPRPGEQFAFEVNLDRCSGCKACVTACHSLNGLDEHETWRDVGLLQGHRQEAFYQQTVTTACHHCVEPGCLQGCPVNAYEKDPITGIVLHLDDQCIGCQYCVLKCPYDVPKYNERLGIVRKCDMCHTRLAEGEAPACVQACPTEAIRITIVSKDAVTTAARKAEVKPFLPDAPHQKNTVPSTAYVSKRDIPANAMAADTYVLRPQHAHWPLVWMLSLTQISVGLAGATAMASHNHLELGIAAVATAFAGLGASILHLGRPLQAWRAFLGLTHSWLSREIFAFSAYAPILIAALAATFFKLSFTPWIWTIATLAGLFGVFTSVMIYHDTHRALWKLRRASARFYGTVGILTGAGLHLVGKTDVGTVILLVSVWVKAVMEFRILTKAGSGRHDADTHSARIQWEYELPALTTRWLGTAIGTLCILGIHSGGLALGGIGITLLAVSEVAEKYLFFTAVVAPKMPGGVQS